jgi:hypothetical protein
VLVIDKGNRAVRLELRLPASDPASVVRLLAPSPRSTSGVTLGGMRLGRRGEWKGSPVAQTVTRSGPGYELTVPRWSELILGVRLAPVRHAAAYGK